MNLFSLALRLIPRGVAAYVLLDALMSVALLVGAGNALTSILSVEGVTLLISSIAAVVTVITCSTTAYVVSLALLVIGKGAVGYIVSPIPFLGLGLMLVADTISTGYREGQGRSIRLNQEALRTGVAMLATVIGLLVGGAVYAGYALAYVVVSLVNIPSKAEGAAIILAELLSNPFVRLAVFSIAMLYLYKLLTVATEVLIAFLRPSKKLSLLVLRSRDDIDVLIDYPMKGLYTAIASTFIAPVVYEFLYQVLNLLTPPAFRLGVDTAVGVLLGLISFAISFIIVSRVIAELSSLKASVKHIVLPAVLALMVYATAVLISVGKGAPVAHALANPDFAELGNNVYSLYINLYTALIYTLEVVSKLVGVAP